MTKKKIGRNDPCSCGSGLKYKKCHGRNNNRTIADIQRALTLSHSREKIRRAKYGNVRPIISADFKGYKWVAVGSRMHYSNKWKTFHDFLFDYLKTTLGCKWGNAELAKDYSEIHPIIKWYISLCDFQREHIKKEGEVHSGICTGTVAAYLSLAYDLYVLRHHSLLQKRLVERLENKDLFQGARYELYVTTTFIKAGFDIDFEDEADRSTTHCEFSATDKASGKKYSVEAKSRHRPGLLGQPGKPKKLEEIRLRIGRLLRSALAKRAQHQRIVFIDINMPPEDVSPFTQQWFKLLMDEIEKVEKGTINGQPVPPAYIAITNHPYHYAGDKHPDPRKDYLVTAINVPEFKRKPDGSCGPVDASILSLWDSINRYTEIPHEFEEPHGLKPILRDAEHIMYNR